MVRVHIPVMGIDLKSSTKNPFYQSHLKSLGFSQTEVAITLLSGPICGALFQPGFGLLSDRWRSRWGRRRPFIVVGTINLVLSMLAVAWVEPVTRAIMPLNSELAISRNAVVVITELSIFSMFVAIQAVQVGLRALILDNCVPTEQPDASAWIARHINLAAFIAHLSAYLDLPQYIPGFHDTAFKDMTVLAVICLSVTMMITCLLISETSTLTFKALPASDGRSMKVRETWNLLLSAHSQIRLVFLVQFLAWLGWFPFLYYTVTYVLLSKFPIKGYSNNQYL